MISAVRERELGSSVVNQTIPYLTDLDFLIEALEEGLLGDEEFNQAKARLIIASPDPESFLLRDTTRVIPLD